MAFGDIVKALTIQITADDLTGGVFRQMGLELKAAKDHTDALNNAWEVATVLYGKAAGAAGMAIDALSKGGEYAEQKAGFESLATSYGINSELIINSIRDITEGNLSLEQATVAASNAIKKGFSEEQTAAIWAFAKKYSDVMGGDMFEISERLEKGILYQADRVNKQFDLGIDKSMSMAEKIEILKIKTGEMGDSVFNFGESWTGMKNSGKDALLEIYKSLNDLAGETGFEAFAESFRNNMREIETWAPQIAVSIEMVAGAMTAMAIPSVISLAKNLELAAASQATLNLAMSANPYVILGGGLTALGVGLKSMNDETDKLEVSAQKMNDALKAMADAGAESAQERLINQKLEEVESARALLESQRKNYELYHDGDGDVEHMDAIAKAALAARMRETELAELRSKYSKEANEDRAEEKQFWEEMDEFDQEVLDNMTITKEEERAAAKEKKEREKELLEFEKELAKERKRLADEEAARKKDGYSYNMPSNVLKMEIDGKTYYNPLYYDVSGNMKGSIVEAPGVAKSPVGFAAGMENGNPVSSGGGSLGLYAGSLVGGGAGSFGGMIAGIAGMNGGGMPSSSSASRGPLKVDLVGVEPRLKEFIEYLVEQITNKAISEGLITAGV